MDISRLGVFAFLDAMDGAKSVDFARAVQLLALARSEELLLQPRDLRAQHRVLRL